MKRLGFILAVLAAGLFALSVPASEVPAITPADFAGPEAGWLYQLLAGTFSTAILGGVAWLAKFIDNWLRERSWLKRHAVLVSAYAFVAYGVDQAWKTLVSSLKDAKGNDGKLTEAEKNQALALAKATAVDYARRNGVDLLKTIGPELLELLIEKIIGERKEGVFLVPLLPDLSPGAPSV